MQRRTVLRLPLAGASLAATGLAMAQALPQTALVIGNDAYAGSGRLTNAGNDARLMHQTLLALGVVSRLQLNLDAAALARHIEDFARSLRQRPGLAWFYYAGHGVQFERRNLLLGTDAGFASRAAVEAGSYPLDTLLSVIDQQKPQAAVVVIDACRDNPFEAVRGSTRGINAPGLLAPQDRAGVLVAYSTAPLTKAQDWPEKPNGPYTTALARALLARPRGLEEALRETGDAVQRATAGAGAAAGAQVPWYSSSLRSEVWLEQTRVTLRPLPVAPALAAGGAQATRGTANAAPRSYRSDLPPASRYLDIDPGEWALRLDRLERAALQQDAAGARHALQRAARVTASDEERTLAGLLAEQGRHQPASHATALARYGEAARAGFVPAQTLLGELQYRRQDFGEAYKWLSAAASAGMGRARMDLAQLALQEGDLQAGGTALVQALQQAMPGAAERSQQSRDAEALMRALQQQFPGPPGLPIRK